MAVAFVNSANVGWNTSATTKSFPSATFWNFGSVGDLLVAVLDINTGASSQTITYDPNWTLATQETGGTIQSAVLWKYKESTASNNDLTVSATGNMLSGGAVVYCLTGVDQTTPIALVNSVDDGSGGTAHIGPTVTPTINGSAILAATVGNALNSGLGVVTAVAPLAHLNGTSLVNGASRATAYVAVYEQATAASFTPEIDTTGTTQLLNYAVVINPPLILLKSGSDTGTITVTESRSIAATLASAGDSGTLTATETSALQQGYTASDSGTLSAVESSDLLIIHPVSSIDSGTLTGTESTSGIAADVASTEPATLSATETATISAEAATSDVGTLASIETPSIAAHVTTNDAGTLTATEGPYAIALSGPADVGTLSAVESSIRKIIEITNQQRLRIDITDKDGVPVGSGPLVEVTQAQYTLALDEVGTFTMTVPATLESTQYYQTGHRLFITREGEGLVSADIIDHPEFTIDADNQQLMQLTGDSLARVLVWGNTLLARTYSNVAIGDVAADLLTGTGWTVGTVDSTATITARYDGASIWAALTNAAASLGLHVRENPLTKTVDIISAGGDSGLVIRNLATVVPGVDDLAVLPLVEIHIIENQSDLWNRIIPLGSGVANNALTLEHATLSTPYPIQTMTGPDGNPIYYIEDTDSQDRYDVRTNVMKVDSVAPIANSTAEIENAANALYQIAAAYMQWHAVQRDTYEVKTVGLRHVDPITGEPRFQVGQTIRLQYRGVVENERGRYVWKDVDDDLYLMKAVREFQANGADSWTLTLATVDQFGDDNPVTQAINQMWAIQTALKPYTYLDSSGPTRLTADSSHNFQMDVTYDANVTYIHRAILQVTKRTIRSNVAGAAGGGSHSHTISGSTSGSGGGQTSSGGTAHSHAISSSTTLGETSPFHRHQTVNAGPVTSWVEPTFMQTMAFFDSSGNAYGVQVGRNGTTPGADNLWTSGGTAHGHTINAQTSASESSHTHSVSNHTHTISGSTSSTVTDHTHQMNYGVFDGPAASTPQFHVIINSTDVTSALGGPWNNSFTVDVTEYLVDANGLLLRQANNVEISTVQLVDLEVVVKSLLSATAVVPV